MSIVRSTEEKSLVSQSQTVHSQFSTKSITNIIAWGENQYVYSSDRRVFYVDLNRKEIKPIDLLGGVCDESFSLKHIHGKVISLTNEPWIGIYDVSDPHHPTNVGQCVVGNNRACIYSPLLKQIIVSLQDERIAQIPENFLDPHGTYVTLATTDHRITWDLLCLNDARCYVRAYTGGFSSWDENWNLNYEYHNGKQINCLLAVPEYGYFVTGDETGECCLVHCQIPMPVFSITITDPLLEDPIITSFAMLPDMEHFVALVGAKVKNNSLHLMKINGLTLEHVGLICGNVSDFVVNENGDIDVVTSDSNELQRKTLACMLKYREGLRTCLKEKLHHDSGSVVLSYLFKPRQLPQISLTAATEPGETPNPNG